MGLRGKQKRYLRAQANNLRPLFFRLVKTV